MSRIIPKLLILSFFLIGFTSLAIAQPKDNSPFSQFGIGDFFDTSMPASHAMGGLGSVYHDFFEANLENPASLGFLQYTSLQLGFFAKRSGIKRFEDKAGVWSGNLDHLSLNIPIINPLNEALERREIDFSWGTSVSLSPYSQVGYFSQKSHVEYDCAGRRMRGLHTALHAEHMGAGAVIYEDDSAHEWESIVPDSLSETLWKVACK